MIPDSAQYQRRYRELRAAMAAQGITHLLVTGSGDHSERGFIRYLTGHSLVDRWGFCLLGPEGDPVLVLLTVSQRFWAERLGYVQGVRVQPDPVAEVIRMLNAAAGAGRLQVGVVGLQGILRVADYRRLVAGLPQVDWADATAVMEAAMARKDPEELASVAGAARAADAGYRHFMAELAPGRTEWELNARVQAEFFARGAFDTIPLGTHRDGEPYLRTPLNRPYEIGDWVMYSVEIPSPGGYWVELARMFSLGEPRPEVRRQVECLHRVHRTAATQLRPGVRAGQVAEQVEAMVRAEGFRTGIWTGHGIGLNLIEAPALVVGDDTPLAENMVVAMHPHVLSANGRIGTYVSDTFVITPTGGRALSEIPWEFFVV